MKHKKYNRFFRHLISFPFIWAMIIPLIILDIFLTIYHNICFRLYKLPLVKRSNYIKIDRHKLKYLTIGEKIGCAYCGYANGLIHYAHIIAGKTEEYWCGIKHKKYKGFIEPTHHKTFIRYNDEKAYRNLEKK